MKKIILLCTSLLVGCNTLKTIETNGFRSSKNVIFYEKDSVAILSAIEYSIDNNKYVKEMTFKLVNMNHADKVKNLLFFIHEKHKGWEIELDYPVERFNMESE